ncbi:MAG: DsbE family thiol:disulfide interchange protein [Alphaproteobacteria bacterium]|nr:DsbE family thiol:disulfide interchange protein [Alphaproteobacteria bacterium]
MKRLIFILPLIGFAVMAVYLAIGLTKDPRALPSVLIDQEVPPFDLAAIEGREVGFKSDDLPGEVSLVNIFGSWCIACRVEHPFLMKIKEQKMAPLHGIDWREQDRKAGPAWLARFGDPYSLIGDDPKSKAAIAFGVTGAPETFVVDKRGFIRYKHVGPLSQAVWDETIQPMLEELRKQ